LTVGENLSEERFFPEPLSKDFLADFFSDRAHTILLQDLHIYGVPYLRKNKTRSFREGV
jgi:hypothetical protein